MLRLVLSAVLLLSCSGLTEARLTDHFIQWLNNNGYESYDFQRDDLGGNSFGGKSGDNDTINNEPVIFIHRITGSSSTFDFNRDYYLNFGGYKNSEVYGTTWGTPDPSLKYSIYLSKAFLTYNRKFVEAVLAYTNASKIDIIGHSMGNVISRLVIKGGQQWDNETYDLGDPLTSKVDTFIGIVGLNLGSNECYKKVDLPLCNKKNGHYPGVMTGTEVVNRSEILENLNMEPGFEGSRRYSMFSTYDDVIKNGDLVYCQYTSHLPGSDLDFRFTDPEYTHASTLSLTAALQVQLFQNHTYSEEFKKWVFKV